MTARARRAGSPAAAALGGGRGGRVAAVHERAVVLLLDDGPLVALLPRGAPLHPWAVELEGPLPAGVAEGGQPALDLSGAAVEELRLRRRLAGVDAAATGALAARLPRPGAADPFEPALAAALASHRGCGDPAVLAVLVGVGEGLTPSGDDVVVGALAALDALGDEPGRARLGAALAGCAVRTTKLAAQMIESALDGRYAEPVLDLLEALADRAPATRLDAAASALLAVGHRSGADTLRGVVAVLGRAAAA